MVSTPGVPCPPGNKASCRVPTLREPSSSPSGFHLRFGLCFSAPSACTPLMLSVQVSFHMFLGFLLLVPPILYLMDLKSIPRSSRSSVGSLLIYLISGYYILLLRGLILY